MKNTNVTLKLSNFPIGLDLTQNQCTNIYKIVCIGMNIFFILKRNMIRKYRLLFRVCK